MFIKLARFLLICFILRNTTSQNVKNKKSAKKKTPKPNSIPVASSPNITVRVSEIPYPEPKNIAENIENAGWTLLSRTGKQYGIDLTNETFELAFSTKMVNDDQNFIQLHVTGELTHNHSVYTELRSALDRRYKDIVHTNVSNIWFFLASHACTTISPDDVDGQIQELLDLSQKAISGTPFFPLEIVKGLMDTATAKMNPELAPLVKAIGDDILAQSRYFQQKKALSESPPPPPPTGKGKGAAAAAAAAAAVAAAAAAASTPKEEKISAEYFQFWQQLCQFTDKYVTFADILKKPVTFIRSEGVTVTLSNLQPDGGPLTLEQIDALNGFLEAKIIANANIDNLLESSKPVYYMKKPEIPKIDEEETDEGEEVLAETEEVEEESTKLEDIAANEFSETEDNLFGDESEEGEEAQVEVRPGYDLVRRTPEQIRLAEAGYAVAVSDSYAFFTGYCTAVGRPRELTLVLGRRHAACPTRMAEFQFLVEVFRDLKRHTKETVLKHRSSAVEGGSPSTSSNSPSTAPTIASTGGASTPSSSMFDYSGDGEEDAAALEPGEYFEEDSSGTGSVVDSEVDYLGEFLSDYPEEDN